MRVVPNCGRDKVVPKVGVPFVGNQRRERKDLFQQGIRLEERKMADDDVFDGDVVRMVGQGENWSWIR